MFGFPRPASPNRALRSTGARRAAHCPTRQPGLTNKKAAQRTQRDTRGAAESELEQQRYFTRAAKARAPADVEVAVHEIGKVLDVTLLQSLTRWEMSGEFRCDRCTAEIWAVRTQRQSQAIQVGFNRAGARAAPRASRPFGTSEAHSPISSLV